MRRLLLSLSLLGCAPTTPEIDFTEVANTIVLYDTEGRWHVLELTNSPMAKGRAEMLLFCRVHEFPEMVVIGWEDEGR